MFQTKHASLVDYVNINRQRGVLCWAIGRASLDKNMSKNEKKHLQNQKHSSLIRMWLNVKNINSIEPDECPDDSSGTHQGGIGCLSGDYEQT